MEVNDFWRDSQKSPPHPQHNRLLRRRLRRVPHCCPPPPYPQCVVQLQPSGWSRPKRGVPDRWNPIGNGPCKRNDSQVVTLCKPRVKEGSCFDLMAAGYFDPPHDMIQWRRLSSIAMRQNVFSFYRRGTAKAIKWAPYTEVCVPCLRVKPCLVGTTCYRIDVWAKLSKRSNWYFRTLSNALWYEL